MKIFSRLLIALILGTSLQASGGAAYDVGHVSISQWIPVNTSQTLPANNGGWLRFACDATSGAVTLTLPTAVLNFNSYELKKIDGSANACTLATTSAQTIDGASTKSLTGQYTPTLSVTSDNANWAITAGSSAGGAGTVTTVSVTSANGLSGSVATATSTPAITLAPTFTGITYSNGTGLAAAVAGNFPTLNQSTTGNAATATALASVPSQCTGGQFATGIAAAGTANCSTPAGSGNVNNTGTPTAGQFAEWTSSTVIGGQTLGGDCTLSTATITCTKTGGAAFVTSATVDTTNAANISSGTLSGARMSAVNLAITSNGGATGILPASNLPSALSASTSINGTSICAGCTLLQNGGALGTPSSGTATNLTGLPLSTGVTGTLQAAQEPAHTGDATNTAGSLAMTVKGVNGTAFSGLATGLLKNTTTTGIPSIATSADVIADWSGTCSSSTFLRGDGACQTPAGAGNVSNTGTPLSGQLAQWTSATVVQGLATTGSGNAVLATSPTLVTPALGIPSVLTLTNATGLPLSTGVTGTLAAAQEPAHTGDMTNTAGSLATTVSGVNGVAIPASATVLSSNASHQIGSATTSGSGAVVLATSPTLIGPALGTPVSGVATNLTGLPLSTGVTGTLAAAQEPAHTGDVTNTAGSLATTVVRINGTSLAALSTGILKNTTTTGVPSIATSADVIADWTGTCSSGTFLRGDGTCAAPGGTGTVTSVAATVPSFLSISGSPVTTSGTLAIGLSGTALPVANGGTGTTTSTGSGNVVLSSSPTLVTPALGTPSALTLSNATGLPLSTGVTGNLPVTNLNAGTSASSATFWRGDGTWSAPAGISGMKMAGGVMTGVASSCTVNQSYGSTVSGTCSYGGVGNYGITMAGGYFSTNFACTASASSASNLIVQTSGATAAGGSANFIVRNANTGSLVDGTVDFICFGT